MQVLITPSGSPPRPVAHRPKTEAYESIFLPISPKKIEKVCVPQTLGKEKRKIMLQKYRRVVMQKINIYYILFTLFSTAFFYSCGTNTEKGYYPDGSLLGECELYNGKRHGKCTEYYPSGNVSLISEWKNGEQTGLTVTFYEDGSLESKFHMIDGKEDGVVKFYFPKNDDHEELQPQANKESDENLSRQCEMSQGKNHGKCIEYYPNGNIRLISEWKNGEQTGPTVYYYDNGNIKSIGNYNMGTPVGFFRFYGSDGKLEQIADFIMRDGKREDNQFISFTAEGDTIMEKSYFLSFHPNVDTLELGKEHTLSVKLERPYLKERMRMFIGICDSASNELLPVEGDSVQGKNYIASYTFIPKKPGYLKLCGVVEDFKVIEQLPGRTPTIELRETFFSKEYWVKESL